MSSNCKLTKKRDYDKILHRRIWCLYGAKKVSKKQKKQVGIPVFTVCCILLVEGVFLYTSYAYVLEVNHHGYVDDNFYLNCSDGVRPVLSLFSGSLKSGTGVWNDPYMIG